jgi:hypothetical protein
LWYNTVITFPNVFNDHGTRSNARPMRGGVTTMAKKKKVAKKKKKVAKKKKR